MRIASSQANHGGHRFNVPPACCRQDAGSTLEQPSQFRNTPKHRNGFTLLELMVVLALIGILSVMIIPEMKGTFENALLRSQARELIGVFNIAHSRAISMNQAHRVRLDVVSGHYLIESETSGTNGEFVPLEIAGAMGELDKRIRVALQDPAPSQSDAQQSPDPIAIANSPMEQLDVITFYPDGTAQRREVHLQDRDGFQLALKVNPVTARVRIMEMERR